LSSADTDATTDAGDETPAVTDERREELAGRFSEALGDGVVETHIRPGDDLWIRVARDVWATTAEVARHRLGFAFFDFLSALDWLPSPFGRDMDAVEDREVSDSGDDASGGADDTAADTALVTGYAGGDTRFQLLARVFDVDNHIGVTFKCDLPDDDLSAPTWSNIYLGANWHERETYEMFGITFTGHPYLTKLYLPGDFEGHPLRKDFPLLARRVKPWPGIVDVEPMPTDGDDADGDESGDDQ